MKVLPASFLLLAFSLLVSPVLGQTSATATPPATSAASGTMAPVAAPADKPKLVYLKPAFFDLASLKIVLGPFSAGDSLATKLEIEHLLKLQGSRTPDQIARVGSEVDLKPEAFATVIGPWFDTAKLPLTAALLKKAAGDSKIAEDLVKTYYNRPRPPLVDPRIQPCVELPKNSPSYPSGHALRGVLWSVILSELAPDLRKPLLARGIQIGDDRIIAGVHFPSDVKAGRKLGHHIAKVLLTTPAFQKDLALAKVEFTNVRLAASVDAAKGKPVKP